MFEFYTPWGLYEYNTLVSSECHRKIRRIVKGNTADQDKDNIGAPWEG